MHIRRLDLWHLMIVFMLEVMQVRDIWQDIAETRLLPRDVLLCTHTLPPWEEKTQNNIHNPLLFPNENKQT